MKRLSFVLSLLLLMLPEAMSAFEKGYEKRIEAYAFAGLTESFSFLGGVSMVNGWRITPAMYFGIGTGFEYSNARYLVSMKGEHYAPQYMIPVYGEFKYNFRTGKNPSPYLLIDAGYIFNAGSRHSSEVTTKALHGLMLSPRFGIDVKVGKKTYLFGAVGPRIQQAHHTVKYPGQGDWEYEARHRMIASACLHIGIIF